MKVCERFFKNEDKLSRYCSLYCDKANCSVCRVSDMKKVLYSMEDCAGENVDCVKCEHLGKYRKISGSILSRVAKAK